MQNNHKEQIFNIGERILKLTKGATQSEIVFISTESHNIRFANNYIHQNIAQKDQQIFLRLALDKRIGSAACNQLDLESLKNLAKGAFQIAKNQSPDPYFYSFPVPKNYLKVKNFDEEIKKLSFSEKTKIVKKIIHTVKKENLIGAGLLSLNSWKIGIINSNGIKVYHPLTFIEFSITAYNDFSSGFAQNSSNKLQDLNFEKLTCQAVEKALRGKNSEKIKPGKYPVILEPPAVANMLSILSEMGFSSKSFEEKSSFMTNKINKKILGENITILDDPAHPKTILGMPFDFEGSPKKKFALIQNGIAKNIAADSYYAYKLKLKNTSSAPFPQERIYGPFPYNLILKEGKTKNLISQLSKGILITRFWYTRVVDQKKTIFTGMTRDGTFLIEKGKIKASLKNLRFNQSIKESLKKVKAISSGSYFSECCVAPALLIEDFNFTASSSY
ncbi:MAG: TldD/PmbA family protein [Armatimonadetes bacterium]|nr:TldD/PmbA family protein [Armatimonadota bacterium]